MGLSVYQLTIPTTDQRNTESRGKGQDPACETRPAPVDGKNWVPKMETSRTCPNAFSAGLLKSEVPITEKSESRGVGGRGSKTEKGETRRTTMKRQFLDADFQLACFGSHKNKGDKIL